MRNVNARDTPGHEVQGRRHMKRSDLTEKLLDIKRENGWSWKHICEKIGGYSEVLIVGAILGQMKLTKPQAANAGELFSLTRSEIAMLNETPMRGEGTPMPPTDPLIYRFYELGMVNGPAWKALIQEEYGDGIMSAIDFDMAMERLPNPKGDRVKITMSGKFLPYKYYGASGNVPEDGFPGRANGGGALRRPMTGSARTRNLEIPRCAIAHRRSGPSGPSGNDGRALHPRLHLRHSQRHQLGHLGADI